MIDLSKSSWKKFKENKDGFIDCILHPKYRKKSFLGFFFIFSTFYIVKTSQISLDNVLTTYGRNLVMNITTSFADITLCLIIARISRTCRYLYVVILIICIVKLLFITIFGTTFA